jgi:chromosomal replication initiation ATPase DnaA
MVCVWLLRNVAEMSWAEAGLLVRKDHSTAFNACKRVDEDIRNDGRRALLLTDVVGAMTDA